MSQQLSRTSAHSKNNLIKSSKGQRTADTTTRNMVKLDPENLLDATKRIRFQIRNWQKVQSTENLRYLQEHNHFKIHVCQSTNPGIPFIASIICTMCNKHVHISTGKNSDIMISNWTRHVKNCITKKPTKSNQASLASYFKSVSSLNNKTTKQLPCCNDSLDSGASHNTIQPTDILEAAPISPRPPCDSETEVGNDESLSCYIENQCAFEAEEQCNTKKNQS